MISSESNGQIKELTRLQKQARFRKQRNTFVVEGLKMVQEAARYGKLQKIYLSESIYIEIQGDDAESNKNLISLLAKYDYEVVVDAVFQKVTDTVTPQGILGLVTIPGYSLEAILQSQKPYYLLLDDVRDPGNLGTMIRTAEGAGMSGVILSHGSVDLFNPKVVRATMGAVFRMPYCYVESLPETIQQIRSRGCQVYATAMEGSVVYDEPDYTPGAAVVIGNEANGVSDTVFHEMPINIRIPMGGALESLNAAVSAAVIMYEINRQNRLALE
ncbi:MAG: RNA methyltransferase [Lachnospiraceae bacterium]|nr:RNA methyltransferase [Lachnospiraceae bacterium]